METFNLEARYTHVKSHYGKAKVIDDGKTYTLLSYGTEVAKCNHDGTNLEVNGAYSMATCRHLKDFINQFSNEYVRTNDDIRELVK